MIYNDPPLVLGLLQRVIDERVPLAISLPDIETTYDSLLLAIEPGLGALVIDELHPISGHRRMKPNMLMRVRARLNGVELRFRTRLAAVDRDADIAAYLLDMPEEIEYRENRLSFRVPIPLTTPLHWIAASIGEGSKSVRARVVDVSTGGVGLALSHPHAVQVLDQISGAIGLPDGEVDVRVRIRYMRSRAFGPREDRAGAEFLDISRNDQRRLCRYTIELQRPALRTRRQWIGRDA